MALGIGYGLPFVAQHGTNPYKTQWAAAREGAKGAGATVEDENAGVGSCLVARGQDVYTDGLPFTPSLLIVPQFYKEGNLYQDVPPFVAEDMTMRFTVTRATTAWRVNSSGLIESVASGVPRIDWLGQSCPALLVEPSAQNLVLQSRDLSVSGTWSASGITAVRNAVGADGTASGACTLTATAASATITQNLSHASQSRIFSAVMRRVTGTGAIELTTNGGTNWTAVTLTTAFTQLACAAQTVASGQVGIRMIASGDVIQVDFTQGEVGPVATSPIATTSGSITRNADQISASGALVSGLIGQTEGTLYAEVDVKQLVGAVAKTFVDIGIASNRIFIGFTSLASNTIRLQIDTSDGSARADIRSAVSSAGILKIAAAYKSADCALYVNGVSGTVTNNNSFTFSALNAISLGKTLSDTAFLNDRIRAAALYTTRLSNDQLAELTRL
jgi:hypothetical protein